MKKSERATKTEEAIRDAIATLSSLLNASPIRGRGTVIADLLYRAEMPSVIDGYPTGGGQEQVTHSDVSDPTLGTVLARENDVCGKCVGGTVMLKDGRRVTCKVCQGTGRRWADPIAHAVEVIVEEITVVIASAKVIDRRSVQVLTSSKTTGRESSLQGACEVCGDFVSGVGEDRMRSGMDNKCYMSWLGWRQKHPEPDPGAQRHRFVIWRRNALKDRADQEMDELEATRGAGLLPPKA